MTAVATRVQKARLISLYSGTVGVCVICAPSTYSEEAETVLLCVRHRFHMCSVCEEYIKTGDTVQTTESSTVCDPCVDANGFEECENCSLYSENLDDEERCSDCSRPSCHNCGDQYDEDDLNYNGECRDCSYTDVDNGNPNYSGSFRRGKREGRDLNFRLPYLGWELEVELEGKGANTVTAPVQKLDWLEYKGDGSLTNGVEMASAPMTLAWVKEHEADIVALLQRLKKDGIRSYSTDTCGMHVHLNRKAFKGDHLYRFIHFVYENPDFIKAMSQRTEYDLNRWASLDKEEQDEPNEPFLVAKAAGKKGWEKYSAVNTGNEDTVEVRIFKGTLNPTSFMKNLELVTAMYEYTRLADYDARVAEAFVAWMEEERNKYPNLYKFLVHKSFITDPTAAAEESASLMSRAA